MLQGCIFHGFIPNQGHLALHALHPDNRKCRVNPLLLLPQLLAKCLHEDCPCYEFSSITDLFIIDHFCDVFIMLDHNAMTTNMIHHSVLINTNEKHNKHNFPSPVPSDTCLSDKSHISRPTAGRHHTSYWQCGLVTLLHLLPHFFPSLSLVHRTE